MLFRSSRAGVCPRCSGAYANPLIADGHCGSIIGRLNAAHTQIVLTATMINRTVLSVRAAFIRKSMRGSDSELCRLVSLVAHSVIAKVIVLIRAVAKRRHGPTLSGQTCPRDVFVFADLLPEGYSPEGGTIWRLALALELVPNP